MGTLRPHGIHCTVQRGVQTVRHHMSIRPCLTSVSLFFLSLPSPPPPLRHLIPKNCTFIQQGSPYSNPFFTEWRGDAVKKEMGWEKKERRLSNASIKRHLKARETLPIDWRDIQRKRRQRGRGKRTQNRKGGRDIRERGVRLSDCPTLPLCFPQVATSPQQHRDPLTTWYWCFI